jgi:DNA-binding NarL/FixJ family response regulator
MMTPIRLLLVDDHAMLRSGLRAILETESDIEVVGEAATGEAALEAIGTVEPDIVLMDLDMPGMGGLETTRRIAALKDGPRVLILTQHTENDFVVPVLEAGGSGYITKNGPDEELVQAVRTVASGEVHLAPNAASLLLKQYKNGGAAADPLSILSERERDVLMLTVEGYSSREIGGKLFISPKTVDTYRARIMDKLKFKHRSELVRFALQTGLLHAD